MIEGKCEEPERFLLFGQKNKISRLLIEDGEVPDVGMLDRFIHHTDYCGCSDSG